ncbi:Restin [Orchesella cincta]|uniref:Restin n=1 Tax=Orchesella cincta TaxID=48709 RepID=A0A1D2M8Q9_ORCCI|nr:Restin [Orchesella cincta]
MPSQMDYAPSSEFIIGDTVYVNGEGDYRGKICYLGEVHFAKGEFAGVVLDHPVGNHDGAHRGRRYFQCDPNHGIFSRVSKISKIPLIPATNDNSACGLYREPTPPRSFREMSPFSVSSSGRSRSFSKSPSPTPSSSLYSCYKPQQELPNLRIGERVIVASSVGETKTGILRYLGCVEFADGEWAGIELFHPLGKNDGTVRGVPYFVCKHPFGLFVPSYKVESSPANKTLVNKLGTKVNVHRILQYSSRPRTSRAGSYEDDFY